MDRKLVCSIKTLLISRKKKISISCSKHFCCISVFSLQLSSSDFVHLFISLGMLLFWFILLLVWVWDFGAGGAFSLGIVLGLIFYWYICTFHIFRKCTFKNKRWLFSVCVWLLVFLYWKYLKEIYWSFKTLYRISQIGNVLIIF